MNTEKIVSNPLNIYNSLTRSKNHFVPHNTTNVKMYVCGPSLQSFPSMNDIRSAVVFDVIFRMLRFSYGVNNVKYVRNYDDISDHIIKESADNNVSISYTANKSIIQYEHELSLLNVIRPTYTPRTSAHIRDIVRFIRLLINKRMTLEIENHIFFDIDKYKEYGALCGRVDEHLHKNFLLWKPSDSKTSFDSPWGRGIPGPHVGCSALSEFYLGEKIDIHGGNINLKFPYHENEIAQSEVAFNVHPYSQFWIHNELTNSDESDITISQLGIDPMLIRYILMKTHYRKQINWKKNSIDRMEKEFNRLMDIDSDKSGKIIIDVDIMRILYNDFNVPGVLAKMQQLYRENEWIQLSALNRLLGFEKT